MGYQIRDRRPRQVPEQSGHISVHLGDHPDSLIYPILAPGARSIQRKDRSMKLLKYFVVQRPAGALVQYLTLGQPLPL